MSRPDLSPGAAWLAGRTARERKVRGQWSTPWWIAEAVVAELVADGVIGPSSVVLDPACGDGRWLLAVHRQVPTARLVGIDVDPAALHAARQTLPPSVELFEGDALGEAWPDSLRPDVVVGNPPFVRPQNLPKDARTDLWRRFSTLTDKADLYCCFVERSLERADHVAVVLPENWLHLASFAALRDAVANAGVDTLFGLPRRAMPVPTVLLRTGSTRQRAGQLTQQGPTDVVALHRSADSWSLAGPLPQLEGRPLGQHDGVRIHMGIVCGDYPRYVHTGRQFPEDQPTCRGKQVQRWRIDDVGEFVRYLPRDMLNRKPWVAPKTAAIFDVPAKIVLAGTSGTELRAAMDTERRYPLDSCYVIHAARPWAVLGFLLSDVVNHWYGARHRAPRVKGVEVARIPLPEPGPAWDVVAEAARESDDDAVNAAVRNAYGIS